MAKISIFFGLLLVTLGLSLYVISDLSAAKRWTALIPSGFGVLIGLFGIVSLVPKWRKHAAHIAALLGLLGGIGGFMQGIKGMQKEDPSALAVSGQLLMGIICIIYVGFCVKSFIMARKAMREEARKAATESTQEAQSAPSVPGTAPDSIDDKAEPGAGEDSKAE